MFAERWGGSDFSTSGAGTSKAKFCGSCWTAPHQFEEDFEEPMNVASSDDELHEDFLSDKEFASAPDDSEVPKDPQMTYQTRSALSHAETPAAMSPEPAEAPFIPKVEQISSTAHPSTIHCSAVIDVAAINDTADSLTIAYGTTSRANVSVSSNEASFGTNSSSQSPNE